MTYDLPDKIENNALVFYNKRKNDCDPNIVTLISFNNGIPKEFLLVCKDNSGDLYIFTSE